MDGYISREVLLRDMLYAMAGTGYQIRAMDVVQFAPTADVVDVRHGHWEWFEEWIPSTPDNVRECEDCGWRCSECKTALADVVGGYWDNPDEEPELNFCPNCGVKMDGKRKDSEE